MADTLVQITLALKEPPASVSERFLEANSADSDAHTSEGLQRLFREVGRTHASYAKALVRVDSVTRGAATGTVVVESDDTTAGDILTIHIPNLTPVVFTAVSTDAAVTAAPGTGLWSLETATDTAQAQSLRDAINDHPRTKGIITASESSGTITLTADEPGSWAHTIVLAKTVTTAGALTLTQFSGGDDILDQPTMDIVFGTPNITADDTISVGARTYTWKASASADGEITLSTTETTAATNFAAAINADTNLTGICTASVNSATVTLTFVCDPRLAQHIVVAYTEANAGSVVPAGTVVGVTGAEAPLVGTTLTGSSSTRTYGGRGAA